LGGYVFGFAFNGDPIHYKITPPHAPVVLAPETMALQSGR